MLKISRPTRLLRDGTIAISSLLSVAMIVSGCSSSSPSADKNSNTGNSGKKSETFKIGALDDLTGLNAKAGQDVLKGMKYAVDHYSADPRMKGIKIDFLSKDHGASQSRASTIVSQYISGDKVSALAGFDESQVAMAVQPLINKAKVPAVSSAVIDKQFAIGSAYTALGKPSTLDLIDPFVKKAVEVQKWKTAAVLYDSASSSGPASKDAWNAAFAKYGVKVTQVIPASGKDTNYQADLAKAKATNPDVLIMSLSGVPSAQGFKQACDMGWKVHKASLSTFYNPESLNVAGPTCLEGTLVPVAWTPDLSFPETKEFVDGYQAKWGTAPSLTALDGYMSIATLVEAMLKAGTTDHDAVAKALKGISFMSPYGTTTLNSDGVPQSSGHMVEIKDGKFVTVS